MRPPDLEDLDPLPAARGLLELIGAALEVGPGWRQFTELESELLREWCSRAQDAADTT